MAAHPESALCRLAEEAGGVDGRTPFLAAEAGDETALAVCRAYVEELAEGTASLINILRPEAVAFGGGVAGAPEHLLLEALTPVKLGNPDEPSTSWTDYQDKTGLPEDLLARVESCTDLILRG